MACVCIQLHGSLGWLKINISQRLQLFSVFFTNLGVINNLRWDSIRNLAMLFTRTYNKLTRWQICGGWHFYSDLVTVGCNSYKDV